MFVPVLFIGEFEQYDAYTYEVVGVDNFLPYLSLEPAVLANCTDSTLAQGGSPYPAVVTD